MPDRRKCTAYQAGVAVFSPVAGRIGIVADRVGYRDPRHGTIPHYAVAVLARRRTITDRGESRHHGHDSRATRQAHRGRPVNHVIRRTS
jgi:hypothetical protein